jgi:hypothetical protein
MFDLELSRREAVRRHCREVVRSYFVPTSSRIMRAFAILNLDYYSATVRDVQRNHRLLALKHHPDRGGDPDEFRLLQDAYRTALAYVSAYEEPS